MVGAGNSPVLPVIDALQRRAGALSSGSVVGAAIGAAILGLAETFGLAYAPTYSVVFTFLILVLVLAFRPRGILGRPA